MAGAKVNNYAQDDTNILELQLTTDKTFKGYHQLTLTEYDTTTVPAIAAGSAIECNGALYKFDSEEAISTTDPVTSSTVADGTVYVCIVPSTDTCTAAFTATSPTWSDSKQGWYGTGDQANYRYAEFICQKSGTSYYGKTRMFMNNGDIFYYSTDATERTLSPSSPRTDETNLIVTIPIKQGCVYELILTGEIKYDALSCIIYGKSSTEDAITFLINNSADSLNLTTYAYDKLGALYSPSVYSFFAFNRLFIANDTTTLANKMSWGPLGITYTAYIKNREMLIRELRGISIL